MKMKMRVCLSMLLVVIAVSLSHCVVRGLDRVDPSKVYINKVYDTEEFDAIHTSVVGEVIYTQGDARSVRVYAPDNVMPHVEVEVQHNTLYVTMNKKVRFAGKYDLKVMICSPNITQATTTGVENFKFAGRVEAQQLSLNVEGVGSFEAEDLVCTALRVNSSGVGNLKLKGKTVEASYTASGVGNIKAYDLAADSVHVEASGVGNVQCSVSQAIEVDLSGVGNVKFKGNPQTKKFSKNGVGKIKQVD